MDDWQYRRGFQRICVRIYFKKRTIWRHNVDSTVRKRSHASGSDVAKEVSTHDKPFRPLCRGLSESDVHGHATCRHRRQGEGGKRDKQCSHANIDCAMVDMTSSIRKRELTRHAPVSGGTLPARSCVSANTGRRPDSCNLDFEFGVYRNFFR
jgi:hypothetical protein